MAEKTEGVGKSAAAYAHIKGMIMNNELKAGEIVSENRLAGELGMSRTPVREAIRALANEGHVEVHQGVGILVKHVTIKEMFDVNSVRLVLECFAIRSSIDAIQPHELDELIGRLRSLRARICEGEQVCEDEIYALDTATHALYINRTGNDVLIQMRNELETRVQRYQKMSTSIVNDYIRTVDEHIGLLGAIRAKEPERACELLESHIFLPLNAVVEGNRENIY